MEAVLNPEKLERTAAIICLDFDDPMEIMNNLRAWLSALSESIFRMTPNLAHGIHEKMKQKVMRHIQTYEKPQLDENGNLII